MISPLNLTRAMHFFFLLDRLEIATVFYVSVMVRLSKSVIVVTTF